MRVQLRSSAFRVLAAVAAGLVCGWGLTAAAAYIWQEDLLYPRGGEGPALSLAAPVMRDVSGDAWGWIAEPEGGDAVATVVFFHGNAGRAEQRYVAFSHHLTQRGYRVVFAEYPGYGERAAALPVSRAALVSDGQALLQAVHARFPRRSLILAGESLGAGVAAAVASQVEGASAPERVVLVTPWNRLSDVAAEVLPWLPVKQLLRADYDSCSALKTRSDRVSVVLAERDRVIPPHHARALAKCLALAPERVLVLPAAGHNDWSRQLSEHEWDRLFPPARLARR